MVTRRTHQSWRRFGIVSFFSVAGVLISGAYDRGTYPHHPKAAMTPATAAIAAAISRCAPLALEPLPSVPEAFTSLGAYVLGPFGLHVVW
jgi:hypothetical protein